MALENDIKSLTPQEVEVLYWLTEKKSDNFIGDKLGVGESRVRQLKSSLYDKIKVTHLSKEKRESHFRFNVRPILLPLMENNPDNLKNWPLEVRTEEIKKSSRNWWPVVVLGVMILCVGIGVLGTIAYFLVNGFPIGLFPGSTQAPTQLAVPSPTTQSIASPGLPIAPTNVDPAPSSTILPPVTSGPILVTAETVTPSPTSSLPNFTPKPYYNTGEAVFLKENVYITLIDEFTRMCGIERDGQFRLRFEVTNTAGGQFLLRFDPGTFHATDDVGTQYPPISAGVQSCREIPGTQVEDLLFGGRGSIGVILSGDIPFEATYLLITFDWISGEGPITFRKDL